MNDELLWDKDIRPAHNKLLYKYYIVFTTKYEYKVAYNHYRISLREILRWLYDYKNIKFIVGYCRFV